MMTTDFPTERPAPIGDHPVNLNILTVDPSAMADEIRLRDLIRDIEEAGASVKRLFPSADIITVEATHRQTSRLRSLPGITGIDAQQPQA